MSKKVLWKDAVNSLTNSCGRFIGIMLLMAVSAFAFIGLKMAGPDMRYTAQRYYRNINLADLTVSSNYGLDNRDLQTLRNHAKNATLDLGYLQDTTVNNSKISLRVLSETKSVSTNKIVSGKLPNKNNQIAISYLLKDKYRLGEWIKLDNHNNLKTNRFKIVGFIRPSEYTDRSNIGQTTVGTGQLSGIAVVKKSAFNSSNYSIARLRFNNTKNLDPYSSDYQRLVDDKKKILTKALDKNGRTKEIERDKNFASAQNQLDQAKQQVQLAENNGVNVAKQKAQLEKQESKLNKQKRQIKQLGNVSYYVNDRKNDPGYDTYQSNSEKIQLITDH